MPDYFQSSFFIPYKRQHSYDTRHHPDLLIPRVRHAFMEKCVRYSIPRLLNTSPDLIKNKIFTHSLKGFTNYIKFFFIKEYQEVCNIPNCYICNPTHI